MTKIKTFCKNCNQFYEGVSTSWPGSFPKVKCPKCGQNNLAPLQWGGKIVTWFVILYILLSLYLAIKDGTLISNEDVLGMLTILVIFIGALSYLLKDYELKKVFKKN